MEKLNRLGWAAGIALTAYGVSVGVRVSDPSVLEAVRTLLPHGWKLAEKPAVQRLYSLIIGGPTSRPNVRRFNLLYSNAARLVRAHDLEETLEVLEHDLEHYVVERTSRRTFVHAGVVGWNGHAIVLPGRSFSGKSSLVKALVQGGASYYSDEFAVLDDRGRAHPYPIPLVMRPSRDGAPSRKYRVEELGGVAGVRPLPVGLVLLTRYVCGTRFRPRPVSAGRAVLGLLAHTLPARRRPRRVLDALTQAVAQASVLRGTRGEAEETARYILGSDLLRREPSAPLRRVWTSVGQGG